MDYRQFYDLEKYLLTTVHDRFQDQGYLSAFDFFCIIIWKANRAKSKVAQKILSICPNTIEKAVHELTAGIFSAKSEKDKLMYLIEEWEFHIPMASAILTILYPDKFTIYDIRVCDSLSSFHSLANISDFERLWDEYSRFKQVVIETDPKEYSFRDKDRYFWGMSFAKQLERDLQDYEKSLHLD